MWSGPLFRFAFSRFAVATLAPVALLVIAAFAGGIWPVLALIYMTGLVAALDLLIKTADASEGSEFPAEPWLSVALAWAHMGLLVLGVLTLSGATGHSWLDNAVFFVALGLFFGQVSNSNAHELIHSTDRRMRTLGMWVYISLLYGHHTSAHVRVHHIYVGSESDPATALRGESFYAYAWRAWTDGFLAGYEAECELSERGGKWRLNPYALYLGGAGLVLVLSWMLGGAQGVMALLLLAIYAQVQLLMSDYVQHYGLVRKILPGGRLEPVAPQHSWNAPHVASSALMLNATRHSDHHVHPSKPYDELALPQEVPTLPYSLPIMASLALWPAGWRKVMDWRVVYWA